MSTPPDLSGIKVTSALGADRRTTADHVAAVLRDAIHNGELADGTPLSQAAIAEKLGVSRVPVREAMRELRAEGLIESRAHHLAVVRGISVRRLDELYTMRALLEGWLIEQATPRIDAARLERARALNEEMRAEEDADRWLEINAEFHTTLYEAAGSALALEILEPLRQQSERYSRLWGADVRVHRPGGEAADHHDQILARVAAGDAAGARLVVESHIRATRDRVIEQGRRAGAREA